ncbi:M15 family metallopeptidase [bacterium]|nr:M15 family metallopeptidase [bacterium]
MNNGKEHFVALDTLDTDIQCELRYHSTDNFTGEKVPGYEASRCFLSKAAAQALLKVEKDLKKQGLGLKIFDAYRPQTAVNHFIAWSKQDDKNDMKQRFYPKLEKKDLFNGYLSCKSGHSRGSSVDLTLINSQGQELDMGTEFDYLDEQSHTHNPNISEQAQNNRLILKQAMEKHGFENYHREWWHFSLVDEPHPDTYFDFVIK